MDSAQKSQNKVPMPVRSECVAAIEKLIEITADLRDKCVEKDKDILLINTIKAVISMVVKLAKYVLFRKVLSSGG